MYSSDQFGAHFFDSLRKRTAFAADLAIQRDINIHASHGRRRHAEPGSRAKSPSDFAHRFVCDG
jgi:hypothetical protein